MKLNKTFSFNVPDDDDVLKHLDKQRNQSEYIRSLIRNDMQDKSLEAIRQIVREEIGKYLRERNIGK